MSIFASRSVRVRGWLLAATGGILVCGVVAMLNWSGTAFATAGVGFNVPPRDTVQATFSSLRILALKNDEGEGEDAKLRIIAKEPVDVHVSDINVNPGGSSGWHSHPGPSIVIVRSGTATVYESDDPTCTGVEHPVGSGFVDGGGSHVHRVVNQDTVNPLQLVAVQIVPAGTTNLRIDANKPPQCP